MILLFILHYVADFLLQTREMGKKKSEEWKFLLLHITIQFAVILIGLLILEDPRAIKIAGYNALIHGVIDWNMWRGYKLLVYARLSKVNYDHKFYQTKDGVKTWMYWEDRFFYDIIGLDQLLHVATLYLLYTRVV